MADLFENGGAAFPTLDESDGVLQLREWGMTLRDYFAAKAMAGFLASPEFSKETGYEADKCAAYAYEHADAMLKARANRG